MKRYLTLYKRFSAVEWYMIGYEFNGYIYLYVTNKLKAKYIHTIKASTKNGKGKKLQLNITVAIKKQMLKHSIPLCTVERFNAINELNNGWKLEKLIYQIYGIEYKGHDRIPFYKSGDITINAIQYQIKFENAQLATYKTLARLEKQPCK